MFTSKKCSPVKNTTHSSKIVHLSKKKPKNCSPLKKSLFLLLKTELTSKKKLNSSQFNLKNVYFSKNMVIPQKHKNSRKKLTSHSKVDQSSGPLSSPIHLVVVLGGYGHGEGSQGNWGSWEMETAQLQWRDPSFSAQLRTHLLTEGRKKGSKRVVCLSVCQSAPHLPESDSVLSSASQRIRRSSAAPRRHCGSLPATSDRSRPK